MADEIQRHYRDGHTIKSKLIDSSRHCVRVCVCAALSLLSRDMASLASNSFTEGHSI